MMVHIVRTVIVYLLLIGSSTAAEDWKPINKISQVPPQVKKLLNNCFLVTDQTKAWLNGDNLALIDLGDGNRMWFSTCERSASQQFTAILIETSQGFHRAKFPQFIDGKVGNPRDSIPAAGWHNSAKTLKGRASGGCAESSQRQIDRFTLWTINGANLKHLHNERSVLISRLQEAGNPKDNRYSLYLENRGLEFRLADWSFISADNNFALRLIFSIASFSKSRFSKSILNCMINSPV